MCGRRVTVAGMTCEVLSHKVFYDNSGGGVTLSGGEVLHQPDFSTALLKELKNCGIHTVVETSGAGPWDRLKDISRYTDIFYYDIKTTDSSKHKSFTGGGNEMILGNLRRLADERKGQKALTLRAPLIPGYNDFEDNLAGTASLADELSRLASDATTFEGVELMPFHKLGISKSLRTGLEYPLHDHPPADPEASLRHWIDTLRTCGVVVLNES